MKVLEGQNMVIRVVISMVIHMVIGMVIRMVILCGYGVLNHYKKPVVFDSLAGRWCV